MISGILVVRSLPPNEYGLYTLALTLLGTMNILADAGISNGVMSQGGKVWNNPERLGEIIATGHALRKKFGTISLILILPLMIHLLHSHHATWPQIAAILAGTTLSFITTLSDTILTIAPKLHQKILLVSRIQILQAIGRLGLVSTSSLLAPVASVILIATSIPQIWANRRLRSLNQQLITSTKAQSREDRDSILKIVKRTLPGSIYYCFSSQITLWLVSLLGSSTSIAQIGALGRINQIITIYTILVSTTIAPRVARLPPVRTTLSYWFTGAYGITAIHAAILVAITATFPNQILWILGSHYANLQNELILSTGCAAVSLLNCIPYNFSGARGWILHPAISISTTLIGQIIFLSILELDTVQGILTFGIMSTSIPLAMNTLNIVIRIRNCEIHEKKTN
jgi:O-antigen/teichoic acid export membrane protein